MTLPATSFAELAFALRLLARHDAASIALMEHFVAGLASPDSRRNLGHVIADNRAANLRIAEAAAWLSALAAREAEIRALFEPEETTGVRYSAPDRRAAV